MLAMKSTLKKLRQEKGMEGLGLGVGVRESISKKHTEPGMV